MNIYDLIKKKISKSSDYSKNFGKLFSASILIGLVSALCIPIIARIYEPDVLGKFQLLLSVIVVFSSVSSFKYEMAIVLPKYRYQSQVIFQIAVISMFLSTLLFCLGFIFFSDFILKFFNASSLSNYIWVLPVGIAVSGSSQILQMILVSNNDFNQLSVNKSAQSISNNFLVIGIGNLSPSLSSILISYISSLLLTMYMAIMRLNKVNKMKLYNISLLFRYAKKYRKFPTVNTANVLLNTLAMNLPVFVLSKNYSFDVVGLYMMANRLLDMPVSLISSSLNQVYIKYAAVDYNISSSKLKDRYIQTLKKLSFASFSFCVLISIFTYFGFEMFLGNKWEGVNSVIFILMFAKAFQLLSSPLSTTLMIVNKQELGLVLILFSLIIRYLALNFNDDFLVSLTLYSIATSVFYSFFNLVMYKSIK